MRTTPKIFTYCVILLLYPSLATVSYRTLSYPAPGTSGTDEAGEPLYDSDDEDPSARGEGKEAEEEEHYLDKVR